jgi:DNA-binding MarR family transcriptional regulator
VTESSAHIGQLLRDAFRTFDDELAQGMAAIRDANGVRPVHNAVLAYLDEDGTRASVLAERSRLTRQAITQLVDELEELGVVRRRPDPQDGRAKIVEYTELGREGFTQSRAVIAEIEARWRRELGEKGYEQLRAGLAALTARNT